MKKFLIFLVLPLFLMACSKDGPAPEIDKKAENKIFLSEIVVGDEPIGLGQSLLIEIEEPKDVGAITTYKWIIKDPEGKSKEFVVHKPFIEYEVLSVGKHEVSLDVVSVSKEGAINGEFTSVESDFGVAVFENSSEVIERSELLNGNSPASGLTNFYWPFDVEKPSEKIRYVKGLLIENYLFDSDKFIAGTIESYNNSFSTLMNGVSRNMSYFHYTSSIVVKFDAVFKNKGKTEMIWREGVSESKKKEYEEKYGPTKEDGYGWALMNRDMMEIRTVWEDDDKEAVASLKAMNNNSLYEFQGVIRQK